MTTSPILLSTLLVAATTASHAQTLNGASNSPQIGDSFVLQYSTPLSPGNAGSDQTWDFGAATVDTTEIQHFVAPQGTPGFSTVPNADLAMTTDFANYGYWIANDQIWALAGSYSANEGLGFAYTDPATYIAYPCSYNSTWTDTYGYTFDGGGIQVTATGTLAAEADGLGTLIMPYGAVSNVLRIRQESDETTLLPDIGELNVETTQYLYVKAGVRFPLAILSTSISTVFGIPSEPENDMVWLDGSSVGIAEAISSAIGLELFPNPAHDRVSITFGAPSGDVQLQLIDGNGRVVLNEQLLQQPMGINRVDLPLNNIPAGIYLVRITAANGDQGVQRLIIE
jgi:hypothetical protein